MEDLSNVSSEEELLQLRNEGKITEEEYQQLSEPMGKSGKLEARLVEQTKPSSGSKRALGVTAFLITLAGVALPVLALGVLSFHLKWVIILPAFLAGLAALIIALVLGIVAWRSVWGKATVICVLVSPFVLAAPIGLCAFVGTHRTLEAHTPKIRQYQLQNWFEAQLRDPITKWKNAAVSSSDKNQHLRDTYLVIDTAKRTLRFVRWADGCERAHVYLSYPLDYVNWEFYHITPNGRSLLSGEVRLKPATAPGKRNVCKEAFVLIGKSGRDQGAWLEIRPGYVGVGSGLPLLDSFEFRGYKYQPGPDTTDESMLVPDDEYVRGEQTP